MCRRRRGEGAGLLTFRLGEDGDAERPDVEEAEPDGGEAEGADQHRHHPSAGTPFLFPSAAIHPRWNASTSTSTGEQRGVDAAGGEDEERLIAKWVRIQVGLARLNVSDDWASGPCWITFTGRQSRHKVSPLNRSRISQKKKQSYFSDTNTLCLLKNTE